MKAYYYYIFEVSYDKPDITDSQIVDEGIIRDSEDTIYPGQNTGIPELPSECECHHFQADGYARKGFEFEITREQILSLENIHSLGD